jgi:hypothetical protein
MSGLAAIFRHKLHCSLSSGWEHKAATLLAGVLGFVCDACVKACIDILDGAASSPIPSDQRVMTRVNAGLAGRSPHLLEVTR